MKLFNADSAQDKASVVSYSDSEWPFGTFWVEGKSAAGCAAISDANRVTFAKTDVACSAKNYFNCEFQCKLQT